MVYARFSAVFFPRPAAQKRIRIRTKSETQCDGNSNAKESPILRYRERSNEMNAENRLGFKHRRVMTMDMQITAKTFFFLTKVVCGAERESENSKALQHRFSSFQLAFQACAFKGCDDLLACELTECVGVLDAEGVENRCPACRPLRLVFDSDATSCFPTSLLASENLH